MERRRIAFPSSLSEELASISASCSVSDDISFLSVLRFVSDQLACPETLGGLDKQAAQSTAPPEAATRFGRHRRYASRTSQIIPVTSLGRRLSNELADSSGVIKVPRS